jgi:AraC-like DNA-binding protein
MGRRKKKEKKVIERVDMHTTSINVTACRQWPVEDLWKNRLEYGWYWRLYYVDAPGTGVKTGDKEIEFKPGSYYLIPPHIEFTTWQKSSPQQFYIHFEAPRRFNHVTENIYRFEMTDQFKSMIAMIAPELRPGITFTTPAGSLLCISLCAQALAKIPGDHLIGKPENPVIKKIISGMHSNPEENFHIIQFAKENRKAIPTIYEDFEVQTGTTTYWYFSFLRVQKAASLLANSNMKIDDIAKSIGITCREHFNRKFKEITGLSPLIYRKRMRG